MSTSPYKPVDSKNGEIRLLYLYPATIPDSTIRCELNTVNLTSGHRYEALSYSWGSETPTREILLGGTWLSVRENIFAALCRLRHRSVVRLLWVDAICINQKDKTERNQQVLLMQKIYGQADRVCVWLGELSEGGRVGIEALRNHLLRVGWHQWKFDRAYGKPLLSFREVCTNSSALMNRSNLVEEQTNGEVRELLDRPWWRRTWIIQEVVLAKEIVMMCGSETIKWDAFHDYIQRIRWTQQQSEVFGIQLREKDVFVDANYRDIREYRGIWHSSPSNMNLFDILYRYRRLECTDARDKIYGFLGIVPPKVAKKIRPDYNSPVGKVYQDFSRQVIDATACLDVLNCKRVWLGAPHDVTTTEAYSVLDQSRYYDVHAMVSDGPQKRPRRGWARLPEGWERIPGRKVSLFKDHNTGQEHKLSPLEGTSPCPAEYHTKQRAISSGWTKRWDNLGIPKLTYGFEKTPFEVELNKRKEALRKELARMPSWVTNWECPTRWDPAPLLCWTLPHRQYYPAGDTVPSLHSDVGSHILSLDGVVVDTIRVLAPPWHPRDDQPPVSRKGDEVLMAWEALGSVDIEGCPYQSIGGRKNALWRTMIADDVGEHAAPAADWAYIETWYDRVGWAVDAPDLTSLGPWDASFTNDAVLSLENSMFEHYLTIVPPGPDLKVREILRQSFSEPAQVKKRYGEYMKRIHRVCAHRALFVTSKGYIGLAPWNAKEGDYVVVLNGGRTLFLLRKVRDSGEYHLVGETFVYGLMAGEALTGGIVGEVWPETFHIS